MAVLALGLDTAWAQPVGPGGSYRSKYTRPLQPPRIFEVIDSKVGLPNSIVRDIIQDGYGFMWFATEANGLVRYDGYEMRIFTKRASEPDGMQTTYVTDLELDDEGGLWIATGDAGVSRYDPARDRFKHYRFDAERNSSLSGDSIAFLFKDSRGVIWASSADGVLNRFDASSQKFLRVQTFTEFETEPTAIVEDPDGLFWVGTRNLGLYHFDPTSHKVVARHTRGSKPNSLRSNAITSLLIDAKSILWVGTDNGLHRFDTVRGTIKRYGRTRSRSSLIDNSVRVLFLDREEVLWVGTEGGLHEMVNDESFTRYARDPSDPATTADSPRRVGCAFQDRRGTLWFGATTRVYKIDSSRKRLGPYVYPTLETEATALAEGEDGEIWAGTLGSGLVQFNRKRGRVTVYPRIGADDSGGVDVRKWIWAIHYESRREIWFSGEDLGLIKFNPRTDEYVQYVAAEDTLGGPSSNWIMDIARGRDGLLWLATWGGGLNRFSPNSGEFAEFSNDPDDPKSLRSDHIYAVQIDTKDPSILWLGTARGGLHSFRTDDESVTHHDLTRPSAPESDYTSVLTIHQEPHGDLWLGTDGGGLVEFKPDGQSKAYFSVDEGMPVGTVWGIVPDEDGHLWVSTNGGGLAVFDKRERKVIAVYTTADGLASNELYQNSYLKMSAGELAIGGGGLHIFDPKTIRPSTEGAPVVITRYKLANKEVTLSRPIWTRPTIELDHDDPVFSLEFAALSFSDPGAETYAYKMDGLHGWIETKRRFVSYTGLAPGDYTFRVKAANRHGVWSENATALRIHVAPPLWRTWWAFSLYLILFVGAGLALVRYQLDKLQRLRDANRVQRMELELIITGAVQSGFLPQTDSIDEPDIKLKGFYRPADRASGDWWWYELHKDRIAILVGDVTGHGPGPAMVTAAVATAFRIQRETMRVADMELRLAMLHREVLRAGGGHYHMTMTVVELSRETGHFKLYSAGGQPVLHLSAEGTAKYLTCQGNTLGAADTYVGSMDGHLAPGDRLIAFTDGMIETTLPKGRLMGYKRFSTLCQDVQDEAVTTAVHTLAKHIDGMRQGLPQEDDWTFVMLASTNNKPDPRP